MEFGMTIRPALFALHPPSWLRALGLAGLLVLPGAARAQEPAADKPTLAVLQLQGAFQTPQQQAPGGGRRWAGQAPAAPGPGRSRPLGELLIQRIDMAYFKTGRFRVIERKQMNAILKEGALQNKGLVDDSTAVTLGKQLGAKFVIVGSYNGNMARAAEIEEHLFSRDTRKEFFPAKLEVRLRMVNTEDGSILEPLLLTASARDPQRSAAFDLLMDDFARALAHELDLRYPLRGYVIKLLPDHEVLADLGLGQGVAVGDVFLAMETGPDVVHPVTGKLIAGERRVVGELTVADAGPESATLKAVSGRLELKVGTVLQRKAR